MAVEADKMRAELEAAAERKMKEAMSGSELEKLKLKIQDLETLIQKNEKEFKNELAAREKKIREQRGLIEEYKKRYDTYA